MRKNNGKSYELLTQKLFQDFLNYESPDYQKITVQHDVQIVGKTGVEHQIDVYWEFEYAGVRYRTILEVKDWNSKVKKEQIMGFKSKLDDITGASAGIFVSKGGFQKGAIEYAKVHGIKLFLINETHLINHIIIHQHLRCPHVEHLSVILDKESLESEKRTRGISGNIIISRLVSQVTLQNNCGEERLLSEFIRDAEKPYLNRNDDIKTHITYKFENTWFLLTEDDRLPKIRINGFEFDFYTTTSEEVIKVDPDWVADYILHDVIDGTQTKFNSVHGVISKRE